MTLSNCIRNEEWDVSAGASSLTLYGITSLTFNQYESLRFRYTDQHCTRTIYSDYTQAFCFVACAEDVVSYRCVAYRLFVFGTA